MYENGKIYTIRCKTDDELIYVGSTCQSLKKRLCDHKSKSRECSHRWYHHIENWDNWYIELYEEYPCENKEQLLKKEGEIIRKIGTLNKLVSGRTHKEYRQENRDILLEKMKEKYQENKEQRKKACQENRKKREGILKGKIICDCGDVISYDSKRSHIKTERHENKMLSEFF